jgi:hypothetical protein
MNASILGAIAAAVLTVLWMTGRSRRPLLRSTDTAAVAALNRNQVRARTRTEAGTEAGADPALPTGTSLRYPWAPGMATVGPPSLPLPATVGERSLFLRKLELWSRGDDQERRRAMRSARLWRHRDALPLLRRGLRDPDPAVVLEAAMAMEVFRGRPAARPRPPVQPVLLPRNVSRTR